MKNFLITLVAVLCAIAVGLYGYESYKERKAREAQGYRTASYLVQGMSVSIQIKAIVSTIWQDSGALPCSNADVEEYGYSIGARSDNQRIPRVDLTGCGRITLSYDGFDGTPAGQIIMQAIESESSVGAVGLPIVWDCVSPHYEGIQQILRDCRYNAVADEAITAAAVAAGVESAIPTCAADAMLYRTVFADDVENRTPQQRIAVVGPEREQIYFFTEIIAATGSNITHEWSHNGIVVASVHFAVKADRWRTWSSKQLGNLGPGRLQVKVWDGKCLIGQEGIAISDQEIIDASILTGWISPYQAMEKTLDAFVHGTPSIASIVTMTPVGELYRFNDGDTPLLRAVRTGNEAAVRALVEHAELQAGDGIPRGYGILYDYDAGGRQALDIARDLGFEAIIRLLESAVAESRPPWAVSRATFTLEVRDGEPAQCRDEAYNDETAITFFAEFTDMKGERVNHEWVFRDRFPESSGTTLQSNSFELGSERWTTQSTLRFLPNFTGNWFVRVTDARGEVLHIEHLRYLELTEINASRRDGNRRNQCDIGVEALRSLAKAHAPIARLEYLTEHGTVLRQDELMFEAVSGHNITLLRWILDRGFEIDEYIGDYHTALTLASELGDGAMVLFLLKRGAEINKQMGQHQLGPLELAAYHNRPQVTQILLEHGADPNDTTRDGVTALHRAARSCNLESTRQLLEYGADPTSVENNGAGLQHWADECEQKNQWPENALDVTTLSPVRK